MEIFRKEKMTIFYDLMKSQWLSPLEIREIQRKKLNRLIKLSAENVPYYGKIKCLSRMSNLSDIINLPFLTKGVINESREDLKARNFDDKYFLPNSTGGSTGESLKFYSDYSNNIGFGITMRNNMWTGWKLGERQVKLWGSHYDISKAKKIFSILKNQFIHKVAYLSSFDMRETDMIRYHMKINSYKPQLITAYPSGISIFADFLAEKGLNIYKPKGIICSGETLYAYQEEKIESVFGCKVFNRYGCREVGNIAHHCENHSGLHINGEHIIVEVIDEDGNPCKSGEPGEIVVTDLDNFVFPFIRYKTGDIGILSDKECSCGRGLPLLQKIEGRTFDTIVGTNGNRLTGNYWTILLRTYVKGIKQFQVVQEKKDTLIIKIIADESFNVDEKTRLIQAIYNKCGKDMNIIIENVIEIPLTKSGKHRFVISKVSA